MGEPRRRRSDRAGRPAMRSPGRPPGWRREHRQRFWAAIADGATSEAAGVEAGVSPAVGVRWFREGGGMPSVTQAPLSGRYLSFARFTMLLHLPPMAGRGPRVKNGPALAGHGAEAVRDAIAAAITTLPEQLRRSLTWDQGTEMAQHVQLRIETGLPVYFCDPTARGSAAPTKTPTACCDSTSRREPTLPDTARRTSPPSLPRSTAALARRLDGEPQPRRSPSSCSRLAAGRPSASDTSLADPRRVTLPIYRQ